jgi:hypothetical protein
MVIPLGNLPSHPLQSTSGNTVTQWHAVRTPTETPKGSTSEPWGTVSITQQFDSRNIHRSPQLPMSSFYKALSCTASSTLAINTGDYYLCV